MRRRTPPFGIPHEAMPAPFGFTGELHDAGLVYLRARWYNPTSGVFLSRDPFGGFATQPYSLHPYQYGYANPVVWTDASGRDPEFPLSWLESYDPCSDPSSTRCPKFSDGWIRAHKSAILKAATRHARPDAGFDRDTLAVLMGAILLIEHTYTEVIADDVFPPMPRRMKGNIAGMWIESWDHTTGPANISIETAERTFRGTIRIIERVDYSDPNTPRFIYSELPSSVCVSSATRNDFYKQLEYVELIIDHGLDSPGPPSDGKMAMHKTLQNVASTLDTMATVLEQGIVAASKRRINPTFFNLATWYNGNVQTIEHIQLRGNAGYGASVTGLNAPPGKEIPLTGRIRFVPPKRITRLERGTHGGYIDKFNNEWVKGPSRTSGEPFEWDVYLSSQGKQQLGWLSRDGQHINVSLKGRVTHR